ncbi:unnamed protein product [Kluyveromyces dobzhanskii CBS 2104]|uniref:WGS project CCBQ000000000 data, contig 00012 n=1 Tax=Kluyveromyces dobzhanskii CBS 2104 TaxID=1427455 RepID=A0A0A8L0T8_9SACH|nr:unnamed protein product [Kluyveromyces dobzhanskii CBS 2104]
MTDGSLFTGDLVLCTVGSYEPWPAVVVPQRILSKSVLKAKENDEQAAVAFFNDSTYYWTKPKQLKRLSDEAIEAWINSPPKRSSKELKKAYQFASDYSTLQEFVEDRLTAEGRSDDLESIAEIQMGEDPTVPNLDFKKEENKSNDKRRGRRKNESESDDFATNSNGNNDSKSRKSSSNRNKINGNSSATPVPTPISELKKRKESSTESLSNPPSFLPEQPLKKRSKLDYSRRVEIAQIFRNKLQKSLVQRDTPPTDENLAESEKLIKKILSHTKSTPEFFDLEALKVSKLHKLLKVITSMPELSQFHESCNTILEVWAPNVQHIKKEKLKSKEPLG